MAMRVRVVTLNVWNTEGDPQRPGIINRELRRLEPDLIAFQEVVQTRDVRMLDRLLDGLSFRATHQSDIQNFMPPFAERYGGSAGRDPLGTSSGRGARPAHRGRNGRPLGNMAVVLRIPGRS